MPLSCDCYPGCWATHSVDWPAIINGYLADELWKHANAKRVIPYGSYVLTNGLQISKLTHQLRVERQDLFDKLWASYFAERKEQR